MAEVVGGAKVRVVRCPKCDKLLPELANFNVYRCGGCDATLQAKKQLSVVEGLQKKADGDFCKHFEKNSKVDVESHSFEFKEELGISKIGDNLLKSDPTSKSEPRDVKFQQQLVGSLNGPVGIVTSSGKRKVEENREAVVPDFYSNDQFKFWETKDLKVKDMNNLTTFGGTSRIREEDVQVSCCPDTGPSNFNPNSSNVISDSTTKRKEIDSCDRVELLEHDRAEILRKLDELRDQLKRSCEVSEAPKERFPANGMSASSSPCVQNGRSSWVPDCSSTLNRNLSHNSPLDMPRYLPATHMQDVYGYREASRFAPFNSHGQHPQRAYNNYMYKQLDPDPVISYHNDGFYHQPACACMHCYNGYCMPPAQVPAAVFCNPRIPPCSLGNRGFYGVDSPSMFGGLQGYNHRVSKAPLHPYEPCNHKFTFSTKDSRPCRPVAGGAPFIICCNCSELLQIPEQMTRIGKHQYKMRCGSCSQIISFEFDGTRLVSSNNMSTLQSTSENNSDISGGGSKDVLQCESNINRRQVISYSIDYDSPSYSDEKIAMPSFPISSIKTTERECGLNLCISEKLHGFCSSSGTSEGVRSPDSVICQKEVPGSTEIPIDGNAITRVQSLPLREHFGISSGKQIGDHDTRSGSMSKRSDQEKVASFKIKQNSVKDVPVATEMDCSTEDYSNAGFSQDSWDVTKDEEEPRVSKGGDSFIGSLIKKSFKDFSLFNQSTESGRSKVSVNGHCVSDRMVKRAEKLAGPIHPGNYWYDYRAGFWGVMGHACLGIIPPFIEEFNYPIHKDCAAGNTGVLVNGRELNSRDLTLLANRGLPCTVGQSYIIEISGKLWDEETGEELDSLGKLAPTVERVKRGFGMRAPKVCS